MTSQISFHPVSCSSAIYLLRNGCCEFQILNNLWWMDLHDEMLFPQSCSMSSSLFCEHGIFPAWQAKHRDQRNSWWRQLCVASYGKWYRAKKWIWCEPLQSEGIICSLLTSCNPCLHTKEYWELQERGAEFGRLFSRIHSPQWLSWSEENDQSHVISHNPVITTANTAVLMNRNLSWQSRRCSQREIHTALIPSDGRDDLGLGCA